MELREYQEHAVTNVLEAIEQGKNPLLIMATGTGKTIVFSEVIKRRAKAKSTSHLVLAHREELIDQAIAQMANIIGSTPTKEKATNIADRSNPYVVGSVQTMQNNRLQSWPANVFETITVDEAHHAPAKSYRHILDHFEGAKVLGVTATPDRADDKKLGDIFDRVAYEYPLHRAIRDKHLSRIVGKRVQDFDIDLRGLRTVAGDYTDRDLEERIGAQLLPIAEAIREQSTGRRTLIFCPTVASSAALSTLLREGGLSAEYIAGNFTSDARKSTLYNFSSGSTTHLVSCSLLLEGYDEPSVDCVVMLRPTTSRALYAQAIGRGTRLFPGKDHLLLLEFTFNSDRLNLVKPYELFSTAGFEQPVREKAMAMAAESQDQDILELLDRAREWYYSPSGLETRLIVKEYGFEEFDPFALAEFTGADISGEFDITYQGRVLEGSITIRQRDLLARYNIHGLDRLTKAQASKLIDTISSAGHLPLMGERTPKQAYFLRKNGHDPKGMTKAQASILISHIKNLEREPSF